MIKLTINDEYVHQEVHGTAIDIAIDAARAIAAIYRGLEGRNALGAAVFRDSVTALIGGSSPVWDTSRVSKCVSVDMVPGADEVIKRVLEGGGTVSAARETARPSGASEAARFKRDTADRLVAYRSKWGPGCMGRLAALCGGDVNADKLTRMCDRERFPIEMWRQVAAALDKLEGGCEDGRQSE